MWSKDIYHKKYVLFIHVFYAFKIDKYQYYILDSAIDVTSSPWLALWSADLSNTAVRMLTVLSRTLNDRQSNLSPLCSVKQAGRHIDTE